VSESRRFFVGFSGKIKKQTAGGKGNKRLLLLHIRLCCSQVCFVYPVEWRRFFMARLGYFMPSRPLFDKIMHY
jgi:hypothetical protein